MVLFVLTFLSGAFCNGQEDKNRELPAGGMDRPRFFGIVIDDSSGEPVAGAQVYLAVRCQCELPEPASTDANGRF